MFPKQHSERLPGGKERWRSPAGNAPESILSASSQNLRKPLAPPAKELYKMNKKWPHTNTHTHTSLEYLIITHSISFCRVRRDSPFLNL
jgi:hypothetical protein